MGISQAFESYITATHKGSDDADIAEELMLRADRLGEYVNAFRGRKKFLEKHETHS